jgi:hypothetical protein
MSRHHARTASVRTIRSEAPSASAWVVLLEPADMVVGSASAQLPQRLLRQGFSVLSLHPGSTCPAATLRTAIAESVAAVTDECEPTLLVLFAGTGRLAAVAARAAIDHDGAGLLSLNGSLLRATWQVTQLPAPILLLGTPDLPWPTSSALRLSAKALGSRARLVHTGDDGTAHALADWGRAVDRGAWPAAPARSRRLALPVAAALALTPAAGMLLSGTPVSAAQRVGDGVVRGASSAVDRGTLSGVAVKGHQRHGDGMLRDNELSHGVSTTSLTDAAGFRWVVNTDVTSTTAASSASGAINDQAAFNHSVTVSTSAGGTTQSAMGNPYDGYGGLLLTLNGTPCTGIGTGCVAYNGATSAQTDCDGRQLLFTPTSLLGLNVSRRVYVPTDDHFERTLNVFNNPTGNPITITMSTANFLASGSTTAVTGTSAGGTTATTSDEWVTTFGAFSGPTSVTPRLGHVLQTTGAAVGLAQVDITNGNPHPSWAYTFTVGAGQTVIIGNYAVADGTVAAAKADSARLAALPSTALECMSAADQAELGNFASAPTVTAQPQNAVAATGTTVNFSASATAAGIGQAPSVQWQQSLDGGANWANISGATSPTLSVVTPAGGADYRAVFHNGIGTTISQAASLTLPPPTPPTPPSPPTPAPGFWLSDTAGGVYSYGAPFEGSLPGLGVTPTKPVVSMAGTADGNGYMMVGANGGVYAFGDAHYAGSLPGLGIGVDDVVGLALSRDGNGYWMVSTTGAVFAFGDAPYLGSLPGLHVTPSKPIVGIAATPDGRGYWLVGADGAVYAFGDAPYLGSLPGLHVSPVQPITAVATTPDGNGYWMVGADGAVYAFGDAPYAGSLPGLGVRVSKPIIGIAPAGQDGYWLFGSDGGTFAFGSAPYLGSAVGFTSGRSIGGTAAS